MADGGGDPPVVGPDGGGDGPPGPSGDGPDGPSFGGPSASSQENYEGGEGDYGGDGEAEEEMPFLKSDHPLLARIQRALFEQLSAQKERVRLQLAEKQEELKKLIGHRENIGTNCTEDRVPGQVLHSRVHTVFLNARRTVLSTSPAGGWGACFHDAKHLKV